MRQIILTSFLLLSTLFLHASERTGTASPAEYLLSPTPTTDAIERLLTDKEIEGSILYNPQTYAFYVRRQYTPLWSRNQHPLPVAYDLQHAIETIDRDGLNPNAPAYHLHRISALLQSRQSERLARLDLLLTDAFLTLARHLHYGVAYGTQGDGIPSDRPHTLDMAAILEKAVTDQTVAEALAVLTPRTPEYQRLKKALAHYRELASSGAWSTNPADYTQETPVRQRLIMSGDLNDTADNDLSVRDPLLEAVKRFQKRHGISADGMVGPRTAAKMALSPAALVETIRVNMERWRMLEPPEGDNYVLVNIPGYSLYVMQQHKPLLQMQAIVGRRDRATPVFASQMRYIVFNPYWQIPETILTEDLIPKVKADPRYLQKKNITIYAADDREARRPIDPASIRWAHWRAADNERYYFREAPSAVNPLGYVKFIFPNPYDIYIHDTPSDELFDKERGTFSSGCIRVRKPIELAYALLKRETPEITYKTLFLKIASGKNEWIRLQQPINVYITYQTARVDENGLINFYEDIYGNDSELAQLIN